MNILCVYKSLVFGCLLLLTACSKASPTVHETPEDVEFDRQSKQRVDEALARTVPVEYVDMGCTSHGEERDMGYIPSYSVETVWYGQLTKDFIGGGLSCGGIQAAGYPLPVKWQKGMTVAVRWEPPDEERKSIVKYTTIPYYKKPDTLWVHFYPNDEVRLAVGPCDPNGNCDINKDIVEPPPENLPQPPESVASTKVANDLAASRARPVVFLPLEAVNHPGANLKPLIADYVPDKYFFDVQEVWFGHRNRGSEGNTKYLTGKAEPIKPYPVPAKWESGMQTLVDWKPVDEDIKMDSCAPFMPYSSARGKLYAHIFAGNRAVLVVSEYPPESPKHPIPLNATEPPKIKGYVRDEQACK